MINEIGMDQKDRRKLQSYHKDLLDVMYTMISPHLISKFIIDIDMHAEIDSMATDRRKMEKLLMILPTRGETAMKEFIAALKPRYSWLATKLQENGNKNNNSEDTIICGEKLVDFPVEKHAREVEKILQRNSAVCQKWEFLARSMEVKPSIVVDVKREMCYSGGTEYGIRRILEAWMDDLSSKASFKQLIRLLQLENMNRCADNIKEFWISLQ